jgi:hypothetical protein
VRARDRAGRHEFVWSWNDDVVDVEFGEGIRVSLADGGAHAHRPGPDRWDVDFIDAAGDAHRVTLAGKVQRQEASPRDNAAPALGPPLRLVRDGETIVSLGAPHYRQSEDTWEDAGRPSAHVSFRARGSALTITVTVPRSDVTFAPRNAENPLDNESADVNGDGIQLYAKVGGVVAAWMLVPELGGEHVRVRPITAGRTPSMPPPRAIWQRREGGYRVTIDLDTARLSAVDLIVNEMPRGRQRRRGQLVLSGGGGEFVYLRGDRQDESRLLPIVWVNG